MNVKSVVKKIKFNVIGSTTSMKQARRENNLQNTSTLYLTSNDDNDGMPT